jgi:hypothetical protein
VSPILNKLRRAKKLSVSFLPSTKPDACLGDASVSHFTRSEMIICGHISDLYLLCDSSRPSVPAIPDNGELFIDWVITFSLKFKIKRTMWCSGGSLIYSWWKFLSRSKQNFQKMVVLHSMKKTWRNDLLPAFTNFLRLGQQKATKCKPIWQSKTSYLYNRGVI